MKLGVSFNSNLSLHFRPDKIGGVDDEMMSLINNSTNAFIHNSPDSVAKHKVAKCRLDISRDCK